MPMANEGPVVCGTRAPFRYPVAVLSDGNVVEYGPSPGFFRKIRQTGIRAPPPGRGRQDFFRAAFPILPITGEHPHLTSFLSSYGKYIFGNFRMCFKIWNDFAGRARFLGGGLIGDPMPRNRGP